MASSRAGLRSDDSDSAAAIELPSPWRIVVLVAAIVCVVVVVRNIFASASQVIGWAVAASLIAMLLAPVVHGMDRRMPRALAIVVTFVMVVALAVGVTWLYTTSVLEQVEQMQESGPAIAEEIEQRDDRIGQLALDAGLSDQVTELTDRLAEQTGSGGDAIRSVALSAPPYFVSMILTIFLLLFGPRMVSGGLDQLSERRRERFRPALAAATHDTRIHVWASIAQGVANGLALWGAGTLLDLPAATLLALFGGLVSTIPYVGIGVSWLPIAALGLGTASGIAVGVVVVLAIAFQVAEWFVWRPFVDVRSLHVGPAIPVISAIVGFGIYGIGGAIYGCVIAVFALALADQLAPGDRELPTPLDDDLR